MNLVLDGVTFQQPYRDYYRGRNGHVAKYIADYFGAEYSEHNTAEEHTDSREVYYVPPITQVRGETDLNIISERDFYGLLVDDLNHTHKAILHPTISCRVPSFYSHIFAKDIETLTIPGITAFSPEDAILAYRTLRSQFQNKVRMKVPGESDGRDQIVINNEREIDRIIKDKKPQEISERGIVLEVNLNMSDTISIGFCELGGDKHSFLALQKGDIAPEDGRNRYLGAHVRVIKGEMSRLSQIATTQKEIDAINLTSDLYSRYSYFNPCVSRISFDCLFGSTDKGKDLRGISDITGRLGGTCPALILSVLELKNDLETNCVESEVTLNYTPNEETASEKNAIKFIDLPSLRLTARINRKVKI